MRKIALILAWATMAMAQNINGIIAVVNNEMITNLEFQKALARATETAPPQMASHPEFKSHVLDQLITESLEVQTAKLYGIDISEAMVADTLERTATDNGMSLDDFLLSLAKDGVSRKDFERHIYNQLMISSLHQQQITPKVNVSEFEVNQRLASQSNPLAQFYTYNLEHFMVQKGSDTNTDSLNARIKAYVANGGDFAGLKEQFANKPAVKIQSLGLLTPGEMPTIFAPLTKDFSAGKLLGPIENESGYHYLYVSDIKNEVPQEILERFRTASYKKVMVGDYSHAQDLYERLKNGASVSELNVHFTSHTDTPMDSIPPRVRQKFDKPGAIEPISYGGQWVVIVLDKITEPKDMKQVAFTLTSESLREEKYRKAVQDWHLTLLDEAHIETYIDAQAS